MINDFLYYGSENRRSSWIQKHFGSKIKTLFTLVLSKSLSFEVFLPLVVSCFFCLALQFSHSSWLILDLGNVWQRWGQA